MPVKIVILWAGKGRRIQREYNGLHKALISLRGEKIINRILNNIKLAGGTEIVPILGYKSEELMKEIKSFGYFNSVEPVINHKFENTNNLYSLIQSKDILSGHDFVVINGDMVFDYRILQKIINLSGNAIAVDANDHGFQLDSPRILIKEGRVLDIGRHRTIEESQGYAVGIYRFCKEFSKEYFCLGIRLAGKKPNAGYHEPLEEVFDRVYFQPCYTENYLWMDVDEKDDVSKAEQMLTDIESMIAESEYLSD